METVEIYDIQDDDAPVTIDNSEALNVPKPKKTLKRLQKRSKINYDDDENENKENMSLNESEREEITVSRNEDSGTKASSGKKSKLDEFAREMAQMRISSPEEKSGEKKRKKLRKQKDESSEVEKTSEHEENAIYDLVFDENTETQEESFREPNKKRRGKLAKEKSVLDDISKKRKQKKGKVETEKGEKEEPYYDPEIFTTEEPDEPRKESEQDYYDSYNYGADRGKAPKRNKKKNDGTIKLKTGNKLLGDFTLDPFDFADSYDYDEVVIQEDQIQLPRNEKKKDIGKLLNNIEKFKTEKIRIPIQKQNLQKSLSTIDPQKTSQPSQPTTTSQNTELPPPGAVQHSYSEPNPTLKTLDSNVSQGAEIQTEKPMEIEMNKNIEAPVVNKTSLVTQRSVDLRSILSKAKTIIPTEDDRLLEVEVAVPHLRKGVVRQTSHSLVENTLFVNYLSRGQSFVNKDAIVGHHAITNKKKDLKSLAAELAQKHKEKKSGNITMELIQSRSQVTDLKELDKLRDKKAKEKLKRDMEEDGIEYDEEEDEKDSDFNPEAGKDNGNDDGEGELTFRADLGEEENQEGENNENKKDLDIDDIRRLEGEEEEEEVEEIEGENEEDIEEEENKNEEETESDDEKSNKRLMKEALDEEKYGLEKFQDVEVNYGEENSNGFDEETRRQKKFKKLKTLGEKILDTIKRKQREKREREERRQLALERRAERMKEMGQYMEIEAELGSDQEENDDFVKTIDRRDEEENEDGLNEDLKELIDYAYNEDGGYEEGDEEALNHFLKDLMHQDREDIKKVIQRAFNSKKRKRNQFDIEIDEDERVLKKMKRMDEIMKQLEEEENKVFQSGDGVKRIESIENDIFNEEIGLKRAELLKTGNQIKRALNKISPQESKPKDLFTDDVEVMHLLSKSNVEKKKIELPKLGNALEQIKAGGLMKSKTITKNSIFAVKNPAKDINILNNKFNKEVMNNYGSKEGLLASLERKATINFQPSLELNNENSNSNSNPFLNARTKGNKANNNAPNNQPTTITSSLGKLFSMKPTELKGPSPNKSYIFKYRNKK